MKGMSKDIKFSSSDIQRALAMFAPNKDRTEIEHYLSRGFNLPFDKIQPRSMVEVDNFLNNLRKGILK
jgi:hypothetical protein